MPDVWNERAVVCGLQAGDREAWTLLYTHHSERVWRYAARLVGAEQVAVADIVQETFLTAARSAKTFDSSRGTLAQWLLGIAHHQASRHWRTAARTDDLRRLAASGAAPIAWDADSDPTVLLEHQETATLVRFVLASLPSDYALLLAGKYLDGKSVEQLVEELGGTTEAIRSRLARARRDFREAFERQAGEKPSRSSEPSLARETSADR